MPVNSYTGASTSCTWTTLRFWAPFSYLEDSVEFGFGHADFTASLKCHCENNAAGQ